MSKRLRKTLENTKFAGCEIIPVSANPGGAEHQCEGIGMNELIEVLCFSIILVLKL